MTAAIDRSSPASQQSMTRKSVIINIRKWGQMVDESRRTTVNQYFADKGALRPKGIKGLSPHRTTVTAAMAITTVLTLASCTQSDARTEPVSPGSTSAPTPTSSIDPRAQPAVSAYETFNDRANNALRKPFSAKDKPPPEADFEPFAFDPFLAQYQSYVWGLNHDGVRFRGTPPRQHLVVKSIQLDASPWPKVVLGDCQTGDEGWQAYDTASGAVLPNTTPSVPPPYPSTVTMIRFKDRWGVQKVKVDASRTCTG